MIIDLSQREKVKCWTGQCYHWPGLFSCQDETCRCVWIRSRLIPIVHRLLLQNSAEFILSDTTHQKSDVGLLKEPLEVIEKYFNWSNHQICLHVSSLVYLVSNHQQNNSSDNCRRQGFLLIWIRTKMKHWRLNRSAYIASWLGTSWANRTSFACKLYLRRNSVVQMRAHSVRTCYRWRNCNETFVLMSSIGWPRLKNVHSDDTMLNKLSQNRSIQQRKALTLVVCFCFLFFRVLILIRSFLSSHSFSVVKKKHNVNGMLVS